MKVKETFKYLGDTFNSKGDNIALCKHRVNKSVGLKLNSCIRKPTLVNTKYFP